MVLSMQARVGPQPRRTGWVLLVFGALLVATVFSVPCIVMVGGAVLDMLLRGINATWLLL